MRDTREALQAEYETLASDFTDLRRDFIAFYEAIDKAQVFDKTGGDSAVSVSLWAWTERYEKLKVGR